MNSVVRSLTTGVTARPLVPSSQCELLPSGRVVGLDVDMFSSCTLLSGAGLTSLPDCWPDI
jgi:hypothetical protein